MSLSSFKMINSEQDEVKSGSNVCMITIYITLALLLCYWLFEVHYFVRFLLCAFVARYWKKSIHILDETLYSGVCLTTDVDTLLFHMNNTRYLREVDFARADFYVRSRLWSEIKKKGGSVAQICTNIRYRRFIRPFCFYTITTKVIHWDHNSIFMEHRFISKNDDFVNAIVMSRQRLMNCSAEEILGGLLCQQNKDNDLNLTKPDLPAEFVRWVECNDISSATLRNGKIGDGS